MAGKQLLLLLSLVVALAQASTEGGVLLQPRRDVLKVKSALEESRVSVARPPSTLVRGGKTSFSLSKKQAVTIGALLAFNSGYINGYTLNGFFQSTKQATAAMTGSWTNSALFFAAGKMDLFYFQAKLIASYVGGSAIASYLNPRPATFSVSSGPVASSFLIASALVVSAYMMKDQKWLFYLLAIANGIQNSITSVHTANLCRSSHYTGISSDMGTFLGQVLRGNKDNLFKLQVFAGLAASFWIGGYTAFFAGGKSVDGLLASAGLYLVLALMAMF